MTTYDLGDTVPLSVDVTTSADVPVSCATMVLTVTLPDGTTVTPTLTEAPSGSYYVDYVPAAEGRYGVRFLGTAPAVAFTDSFDIVSSVVGVASLEDIKSHLRITTDTHDEELRSFLNAATTAMETDCGRAFRRTTVVETRDGRGDRIPLFRGPAISVTTVVESGTTLDAADYTMTSSGHLVRRSGDYQTQDWAEGTQNIVITYVAGLAVVPEDLRHVCRELTRHLWETQRAGTNVPRQGDDDVYIPGVAYTFPRRILELLRPHRMVGIM